MSESGISVGDVVRFRSVVDEGDENERMEVVELRGDRVLLRTLDRYWRHTLLIPTRVVQTTDVVKADDAIE